MNGFIETINNLAGDWSAILWPAVWQSAVLAVVIFLATLLLRNKMASVRFCLWMLVPLRLIVMPFFTVAVPVLPPQAKSIASVNESSLQWKVTREHAPAESADAVKSDPIVKAVSSPAPAADVQFDIMALLMAGWVVGIALGLVRLIAGWRRMHRIALQAQEIEDASMLDLIRETACSLKLRRVPRVVVTGEDISPLVFGIVRPCVVLPSKLVYHSSRGALSAVIAHEFAHVRKLDPLTGWILAICELVYFFHPVVYFIKRRILVEREKACDECVVALDRTRRSIYANALVDAAAICRGLAGRIGPVSVIAESFGDLKKRLISIGTNTEPKAGLSVRSFFLLIILGIICVPGVTLKAREDVEQVDLKDRVVRVYNVTMLLGRPARAGNMGSMMSSLPGGYGGMMRDGMIGGLPGGYGGIDPDCNDIMDEETAAAAVAERLDELAKTIKETVEPNSWFDADGAGLIRVLEKHKLIIRQTPEVHQAIEALLTEMQVEHGRQIRFEARFLEVTEDFLNDIGADVNSMVKCADKRQETFIEPGKIRFDRKRFDLGIADSEVLTSHCGYGIIQNDLSTRLLLRAVGASKGSKTLTAPCVTVLNGEYAALSVSTDPSYFLPHANPNTPLGQLEQYVDYVNFGTSIGLHPEIKSDGEILLGINLSLSSLVGFEKHMYEDGNEYDIPEIELVSLSSEVMVPDGGTLLIGGGKYNTELENGEIAERDLLVLVRADIFEPDASYNNIHFELPTDSGEPGEL
jgi:beta-lactamase regulating signal transducer with metallopeptidase domain